MKRFLAGALALATVSGAALASTTAVAQPYDRDRHDMHDDHRGGFDRDHRDGGDRDRRGGGRHWNQGERLDRRYGAYAEVGDWRARRLPPPRRGYHWVRSGDDYVQAALVGGLIASVIAASR